VDRSDTGFTPRFVKVEPPSDAQIARVVHQISRRIIRKLRHPGYLEAGIDDAVATGYDPLGEDEPELARTPRASVQQSIALVSEQARRCATLERCAALAQALAMKANTRPSPAPAVPAFRGFGCMPMSRCRRIAGTSP
jgi:hypothetical protein